MNYWNEGSSIEEKCMIANEKLKDVLQYQKEEQTFCREVQRIFDLIFIGNSYALITVMFRKTNDLEPQFIPQNRKNKCAL